MESEQLMAKTGKTGVTANTPKNIFLGAGTIHKNLEFTFALTTDVALVTGKNYYTRSGSEEAYVYTVVASPDVTDIATYYEGTWNFETSIIGATSGGNKLTITPEITDIEADGALVKAKELAVKTGEVATLEINFLEITKEILKAAAIGADGTCNDADYDLIESKADIASGDYLDNIAYVGKNLEGKNIIVILDNALCTSGLELEGKHKEGTVGTYTFECYAELSSDLDKLPYHIYYPKAA